LVNFCFADLSLRHLLLQYFTSAHTFSHFFRHTIGLPQVMQGFTGSEDLLPLKVNFGN
jgi:hypothetical protein